MSLRAQYNRDKSVFAGRLREWSPHLELPAGPQRRGRRRRRYWWGAGHLPVAGAVPVPTSGGRFPAAHGPAGGGALERQLSLLRG